MRKVALIAAVAALACLASSVQANVFNMGPGLTSLVTVQVGDVGNKPDTRVMLDGTTGYGSVGYVYSMGTYEVTAGQYTDFLNHVAKMDSYGLYNTEMSRLIRSGCNIQRSGNPGSYSYSVAADYANKPVNYVSYWDACRFANWLCNGQGEGDTESGAYTLNGYHGEDGRTIHRNAGAKWFVPSEDEWYKAAYYKGGGADAGYWHYPTQSDSRPSNQLLDPDPGNCVNYALNGPNMIDPPWPTDVGKFEHSGSAYGTFDQAGNVSEWNEGVTYQDSRYSTHCKRGGCYGSFYEPLRSSYREYGYIGSDQELAYTGFRLATIPEPPSVAVLVGGFLFLLSIRRWRTNGTSP